MRSSLRRGSVFVVSLAILTGLVAVLASVAATQRLLVQAQISRMEQRRARLLAQSAVQRAIAVLYESMGTAGQIGSGSSNGLVSTSADTTTASTLLDSWATLGQNGDERFLIDGNSIRMQVVDASSFINLNTAPQEQLYRLPLTQEEVDSLLDWRSAGQNTNYADGAKDDYYNALSQPYGAALRRLNSLDELLLIRGWTARDIYEPPTNQSTTTPLPTLANGRTPTLTDLVTVDSFSGTGASNGQTTTGQATGGQANAGQTAAGQNKINLSGRNINVNQLRQLQISPQVAQRLAAGGFNSMRQVLQAAGNASSTDLQAILNNVTTTDATQVEGKINLNTASEAVLESIPNLTPDQAQAIVQRQSQGLQQMGDIVSIPGLSNVDTLAPLIDYFTVRSNRYYVRVITQVGSTQLAIQALVDISGSYPQILRMEDQPFNDMARRWGWNDETTTDTVLKESA